MNWKLVRKSDDKFVVESNGQVAAYMDMTTKDQTVYLDYAFVDPAFRGTGIGHFLVKEVITLLQLKGKKIVPVCGYVQAVVRKNNLIA